MSEPIANDWKAINARMQEINAEHSAASYSCPKCHNVGWLANSYGSRAGYRVCDRCENLYRLPKPAP